MVIPRRIDPERGTSRPLKEGGEVETFISDRETQSIDDFWARRVSNRNYVFGINDSIIINIFVFDIPRSVCSEVLSR